MKQKTYIVTGGSRSYGADIVNLLRMRDHIVYDVQRHIRPMLDELFNPEVELAHWICCDFSEAHRVVSTANDILGLGIQVDGMLHAAAMHEELDPRLLSTYDLSRHFNVNVFGPLLLSLYLNQAGVLKQGGRVGFLLDSRKASKEFSVYNAAKKSTVSIVESMRHLFDGIDFFYISMPNRQSEIADDAEVKVVDIMTASETPKEKIIALH